jgi:hypothetical protein
MFKILTVDNIVVKSNISGMLARQLMIALHEAGERTRLFDCMDTFVIASPDLIKTVKTSCN